MAYIEKRVHTSGKITYRVRIRLNGLLIFPNLFLQDAKQKSGLPRWSLKCDKADTLAEQKAKSARLQT